MPEAVYRILTLLCLLVVACPIGTNLGLLHLLWMLVSGRLLAARGAVVPGLSECGLAAPATRRAWAALGQGGWSSAALLARWAAVLEGKGAGRRTRMGATARWRSTSPASGARGSGAVRPPITTAPRGKPSPPSRWASSPAWAASGASAWPARRRACGRTPGTRAPARTRACSWAGGAAVRARRRAGAGRRVRGGAAPGGRGDPVRGAARQELHRPAATPPPYDGRGRPAGVLDGRACSYDRVAARGRRVDRPGCADRLHHRRGAAVGADRSGRPRNCSSRTSRSTPTCQPELALLAEVARRRPRPPSPTGWDRRPRPVRRLGAHPVYGSPPGLTCRGLGPTPSRPRPRPHHDLPKRSGRETKLKRRWDLHGGSPGVSPATRPRQP